jgi:hypothetical protein
VSAPVDPAQMNGDPLPAPLVGVQREEVAQELLRAIKAAATNVTTESNSAAEAQSWAAAAKSLADAFVVLDPTLDTTGVPVVDQQDHKTQLEKIRAQQAAPAQKRRSMKINRDQNGRMAGIEETQ